LSPLACRPRPAGGGPQPPAPTGAASPRTSSSSPSSSDSSSCRPATGCMDQAARLARALGANGGRADLQHDVLALLGAAARPPAVRKLVLQHLARRTARPPPRCRSTARQGARHEHRGGGLRSSPQLARQRCVDRRRHGPRSAPEQLRVEPLTASHHPGHPDYTSTCHHKPAPLVEIKWSFELCHSPAGCCSMGRVARAEAHPWQPRAGATGAPDSPRLPSRGAPRPLSLPSQCRRARRPRPTGDAARPAAAGWVSMARRCRQRTPVRPTGHPRAKLGIGLAWPASSQSPITGNTRATNLPSPNLDNYATELSPPPPRKRQFKVVPHSLSFVITIVKGYSIHCLFVLCNLYILNITRYRSQVIYRCAGFSETE
jgi:hypothetical protein